MMTRIHTVDGFEIAAVVTPGSRRDIVIWMHGITVDKDEHLGFFRDGVQFLAQLGFSSVRFDFRGHGESSGTSLDFSPISQNLDAKAVLDFVLRELGGSSARLHVVGASFGAPPAIFVAARYPQSIRTVSLISPVVSYRRTFLKPETRWSAELFSKDKLRKLEETGRLYFDDRFCISARMVEEMYVLRPDLSLRELHQPTLVLHGDGDSMVPFAATMEACQGLPNVKPQVMYGVDHGFMLEGDEDGTMPGSLANKEAIYRHLVHHIS